MAEQTTYILTFKSSVPDEQDRRANLNRFLKMALRSYKLRLVKMETKHDAPAKRLGSNGRDARDGEAATRATL